VAGIGFRIRKILKKGGILSALQAYGYSAVIGAGAWLIAVFGLIATAQIVEPFFMYKHEILQFLVSTTYLFAGSLIFTGFFQLYFSRYIADRIFEKKFNIILPNIIGMLVITMTLAFIIILPAYFILSDTSYIYRLLFIFLFVVLSGMWILNIILSALKSYRYIFYSFALSYILMFVLAFIFSYFNMGLEGLMFAFFIGHTTLFFLLLFLIVFEFSGDKFIDFDFTKKERVYKFLLWTGLFYNLGIWIDKIIFWLHPETGDFIISKLRASIFYDLPMFLAYILMIPGMAIFLLRLETDFAEKYDEFYNAVRDGGTLSTIREKKDEMILTAKLALFEVFRGQLIISLFAIILSEPLFLLFHFPLVYIPIFHILLIGTWLMLFFISILTILFYLDRQKETFLLTLSFVLLNAGLTLLSIELGYEYYGLGFVLSTLIVSIVGLRILTKIFDNLIYETFMLQ
jgi:uncharacterized membrane protein